MAREPNDCHGDEAELEQLRQKPVRDPDDESPGFYAELAVDRIAARRSEIAISGTPEQFRKMWGSL